jgi:hypothetical protein
MGESEHKREQNKRTRDAQEAKNVSRCTEENRCRATSSMGKGKSCEKIQLRSHRNEMPGLNNESGLFCAAHIGLSGHLSDYLELYGSKYGMKASTDSDLL